jgi:ABC-type polysaccharide/polyol phosphate export permease
MTKTSQRAGLVTSVLVIIFFVTAVGFRISGGDVPAWFPITMGMILCVTTISAVVCIVTASSAFFRSRRQQEQSGSVLEPPQKV